MNAPCSILLSVYAKELPSYLNQSLTSVWDNQTNKPSQIVLVKDGPLTHELDFEIERWVDILGTVLTVIELPKNVGLAEALNTGLLHCKYDLVVRMDTDDIAMPERLKIQLAFMDDNPEIAVSSGFIEEWNDDFSIQLSRRILPLEHDELVRFAKMRSPISHPACIFRKSAVMDVGGYPNIYPEDHLLWVRVIQKGYKIANVAEVILRMRTGNGFITRRGYRFLKGELCGYREMYKSSFFSFCEFIRACFLRAFIRLSPNFIKIWIYKTLR